MRPAAGTPEQDADSAADVLQAVRAIALGLDRYRQALGAQFGLGVAEIVSLGQLLYDGPVRASEVSGRTGLTQGSVTALLDRLEGRGYITRVRPPDNRRVVMVEATASGRTVGEAIFGPMLQQLDGLGAEPGAPSLSCLADCVSRAASILELAALAMRAEPSPPGLEPRDTESSGGPATLSCAAGPARKSPRRERRPDR